MENDQILTILIEKLEKLEAGQNDIRERLTRTEGKFDTFEERQENHYQQNQSEHNQLVSLFENDRTELTGKIKTNTTAIETIRKAIEAIRKAIRKDKSQTDERKGERRVLARGWELFIAALSGGAFLAGLGLIAKLLKIL